MTVDQVSRHAGISKKTFYQHHQEKDQVLHLVILEIIRSLKAEYPVEMQNPNPKSERFIIVMKRLFQMRYILNDKALSPQETSRVLLRKFRDNYLPEALAADLKRRLDKGCYGKDLNVHSICRLLAIQADLVSNYNRYSLEVAIDNVKFCLEGNMVNKMSPADTA